MQAGVEKGKENVDIDTEHLYIVYSWWRENFQQLSLAVLLQASLFTFLLISVSRQLRKK